MSNKKQIQQYSKKKQAEKCLIFTVNSLFSSVFIFIGRLTGKVILNAENLKQVVNDWRSIYDAPTALFSTVHFTLFTM